MEERRGEERRRREEKREQGLRIRSRVDKVRYKDVSQVVQTCHDAGISKLCVKLRPLAVIKG